MAVRYIACRELIVNGNRIAPGKQVIGVRARNLKALVECRHVKRIDDSEEQEKLEAAKQSAKKPNKEETQNAK